jgi:hypothetical protein
MTRIERLQKAYLEWKTALDVQEAHVAELEAAYIRSDGYRNADGTIPGRFEDMDSDDLADTAIAVFYSNMERSLVTGSLYYLRGRVKEVENALIEYALAMIPCKESDVIRADLRYAVTRQKVIDLAMRIDPQTVQKIA